VVDGIDSDDEFAIDVEVGDGVPDGLACDVLPVRGDAVFQVEHHRVRRWPPPSGVCLVGRLAR